MSALSMKRRSFGREEASGLQGTTARHGDAVAILCVSINQEATKREHPLIPCDSCPSTHVSGRRVSGVPSSSKSTSSGTMTSSKVTGGSERCTMVVLTRRLDYGSSATMLSQ